MERIIAAALDEADIPYVPQAANHFYLPVQEIHIRVVAPQAELRELDAHDVIAVRGRRAINQLAAWLRASD